MYQNAIFGFEGNHSARELAEEIYMSIRAIEEKLPQDMQVVIRFGAYNDKYFYIDSIGYTGGDILYFRGRMIEQAWASTVVQHISQINFQMEILPRIDDLNEKRRPIGFDVSRPLEKP